MTRAELAYVLDGVWHRWCRFIRSHLPKGSTMPPKFLVAFRKALATFLFASLGLLIGAPVLGIDTPTWKLALSTGLGALLNLLYRWAEKAQH